MTTTQTHTTDDILLAPMPRRSLGSTGWEASALTMGGVKWDTHIPESDAIALLHRALELGVNTFDTAAGYGRGESERRLGLAMKDHRDRIWINTKSDKRNCDAARKEIEESLQRLQTDRIDLFFIHAIDDDDDYARVTDSAGVLKAIDEYRKAGNIRFVGVSGHWYKHNMAKLIQEIDLDAVLMPVGLFNLAYDYSYIDSVLPVARQRGMAVLGMKVFGAGRVRHAESIEPYLRYSLNLDIDTAVIGCDSIAQLEQTVRIVKREPGPLTDEQQQAILPEALDITRSWDKGEFNWVSHYIR